MSRKIFRLSLKLRIILTFVLITVIIVFLLARASYHFVRNLYLAQLTEQVEIVTELVARQIGLKYIQVLNLGLPIEMTKQHFQSLFQRNISTKTPTEIFIFDTGFKIIVHSDMKKITGIQEAQLLLYRKEISDLNINEATSSLPFKGADGAWYLWGFFRLDHGFWLAYRESAKRLEKVDAFSMLFWYVGFAGLLISVLVGIILARTITKPIDRLVKFSTEIGKGNFDVPLPVKVHGELGILSKSMDKMRHDLIKQQKEREEMLAQIAHEIRNPLGGIELLANLSKEDIIKGIQNTDYLNKILKEITTLKLLITSYLTYSRPQAAKAQWVELTPIIDDVKKVITRSLDKKNGKFSFVNQIGHIWFDPNHLKQILINLISNSVDFIALDGEVMVLARVHDHKWIIEISDDGPGIPEQDLDLVFKPFYTTRGEGTGLGLAISKKLCDENNAQLVVKNRKDRGCIVIISKEVIDE